MYSSRVAHGISYAEGKEVDMKKVALTAALLSALLACSHIGLVGAQDMQTVELYAGCNPVATTYDNGTPIATIVGAVTLQEDLESIWQLEAGSWRGYSPQFPEQAGLTEVDRLDVIFICMRAAGSFERPVVAPPP
jgi:hypothetical protein